MLIIDGGGTGLKIWRRTKKGRWRLIRRIAGNFNARFIDPSEIAHLTAALPELHTVNCITIGLAGLSDKTDQQKFIEKVAALLPFQNKSIRALSDWELQLEWCFPEQDGIVAILGTGSVFAAKVGSRTVRVGGYGRWIGDAGSGWAIGIAAVEQYLRLLDGFFHDDAFRQAMQRLFKNREAVLKKVYEEAFPVQTLAKRIIQWAEQGNKTADAILQNEAKKVAEFVGHLKRLTKPDLPVKLVGGLVEKPNAYRALLESWLDCSKERA